VGLSGPRRVRRSAMRGPPRIGGRRALSVVLRQEGGPVAGTFVLLAARLCDGIAKAHAAGSSSGSVSGPPWTEASGLPL